MRGTLLYAIALSLCLLGPLMSAQSAQPVVYDLGSGVVTAKVLKSIPPTYTPEARTARIQGTVTVEVVVLPDGKVGDARVARSELWPYRGKGSKDSGTVVLLTPAEVTKSRLDQQAMEAAKQWVFQPGTKDGKRVAVRIQIALTFALGIA